MPERTKRASRADDESASGEVLTETPADLGDAAATGEHAYAGERSDEIADDRDDEAKPGTSAHLGENPYAGSPS